ncbi:MAG: YceI family protein [Archangiaceae bacterium]|nr:YceI family protein [Archangiaceae bacterium]
MNLIQKAVSALVVFPALAYAAPMVVDPAHSQAKFTVKHLMVSDVSGTLGKVSGNVELDEKDAAKSTVEIGIDVDPQTQEPKRDEHLKSPDFFDVQKFPKATFKSKKIAKAGKDKFKVTGDLTLKDVTKEVTLDTTLSAPIENPFSHAPTRAVVATGKIKRSDFGLKWNMPLANNGLLVSDEVRIEFTAELTPPKPPEAEKAPAKEEAKPAASDAGTKAAAPAPAKK